MKGKPWTSEQEKKLQDLLESKVSLQIISAQLGLTEEAVKKKCQGLGIEVVVCNTTPKTTTTLVLPKELFSVEEALKMLSAELKATCSPGLDKAEVQRLQVIATLSSTHKDILADYVDYRGIEKNLMEPRSKYADLAKKPRTFNANEMLWEHTKLQDDVITVETDRLTTVETVKMDPLGAFLSGPGC